MCLIELLRKAHFILDSSCQSMYDDSTVEDFEDDHSLCDVGSISEYGKERELFEDNLLFL